MIGDFLDCQPAFFAPETPLPFWTIICTGRSETAAYSAITAPVLSVDPLSTTMSSHVRDDRIADTLFRLWASWPARLRVQINNDRSNELLVFGSPELTAPSKIFIVPMPAAQLWAC